MRPACRPRRAPGRRSRADRSRPADRRRRRAGGRGPRAHLRRRADRARTRAGPAARRRRDRGLHPADREYRAPPITGLIPGLIPGAPAAVRGARRRPARPGRAGPVRRNAGGHAGRTRPGHRGRRADRRTRPPWRHGPDPRRRTGQRGRRHSADRRPGRPRHGPLGGLAPAHPGRALRDLARPRAGRRGLVRRTGCPRQAAGHPGAGRLVPVRQDRLAGRRDQPRRTYQPAHRLARDRLRAADRARALRRARGQFPAGPLGRPGRYVRRRAAEHVRGHLGRCRGDGRVAAGHRRPAPAGRPQAGRARLRARRRGDGGPVSPVRAAHAGAGRHLPGRRAVRGDRADLGLLRAAADLLGPARLGRAGGGLPAGRADSPVGGVSGTRPGRPGPGDPTTTRTTGSPPTAATASWRTGPAPWSTGGSRRCRRCWWGCS